MDSIQCSRCHSAKVVPKARVFDQGHYSDGQLHVGFDKNPDAVIFKGRTWNSLTANVCGECGFVEFFASHPQQLYDAYLKATAKAGRPITDALDE